MSRALNRGCQSFLVIGRNPCYTSGQYFAAICNKLAQCIYIFVINFFDSCSCKRATLALTGAEVYR